MSRAWNFARRPFQDDRRVYAAAGALFLAGVLLLSANLKLFGDYRRQVADTRAEVAALEGRMARADEKARTAKSALASYKVSALAEESRGLAQIVAERRFSWTGLLNRLERTLPSEVGLAHLQPRFEKDGEVFLDLQLYAKSREAVVKTIAALSKDPAFGEVDLRTETNATEAGAAEPFQFQIGTRYEPGAGR
jgi:Tfp pilus assembly protein PilN